MKIAVLAELPVHILPGFESRVPDGHYATWLPQMVSGFEGAGDFEFHWVTLVKSLTEPRRVEWKGQHFHLIPRCSRALGCLTNYFQDRRSIKRVLGEIDPDLVHAWGTEDVYGLCAALDTRRPAILSMQGIIQHYARITRLDPFHRVQGLYEKRVFKHSRCITVESRWGITVMKELAPQAQFHQVEYGVNHDFFDATWQPDPANPRAIFVGSLMPRKGISDAVQAFADPSMNHFELHVFGSGLPEQEREVAHAPNVIWHGRTPKDRIIREMEKAWCLLLPTRADTSPNVVKEARVVGMPVLTTPHGGQSDYIRHGENGFLFEPGDVASLRTHAHEVLSNYDRCRALGACRHEEQRAWFRPENTAARFLELYDTLLES